MNSKRLAAFFIDFIIIAVIYEIPFFILVMLPLIQGKSPAPGGTILRLLVSLLFALILLVFKDAFKGGSMGKKIMKLKIIDCATGENAGAGKRILRNVTWILSWIEIIVYLVSQKRLGDRLANTDVV